MANVEHYPPEPFAEGWPEDAGQENGNYENECCVCKKMFVGNKHRVICKGCSDIEGAHVYYRLTEEQVKFLTHGGATVRDEGGKRKVYLPFVYTMFSDPLQNLIPGLVYEKPISELSKKEMFEMRMDNIFTLEDMIDYANNAVFYASNIEGALKPSDYLKEKFGL